MRTAPRQPASSGGFSRSYAVSTAAAAGRPGAWLSASASWRILVIVLGRYRAFDGPAARAVKAVKVIATASRRMRIRTGGGQSRDGIAPVASVGKGWCRAHDFRSAAGRMARSSCRKTPESLAIYIACRSGQTTVRSEAASRKVSGIDQRIRPARNLRKFFVYPLGRVRKRSYDGGLSFSA